MGLSILILLVNLYKTTIQNYCEIIPRRYREKKS